MYKASIIAGLCCLLSGMVQAATDQPTDLRLEEVQQELKKRQANLEKRQQQQKQALSQLKSTELTLAQQAKTLDQTRQSIENNREQQTHLNQQQKTLTAQRSEQQDILAAQLQSHFMAGGSDYLKMLLNQQDPSKMERTLIYFEYLNEARVNALDALQRTEIKLQQVAEQLIAKAHQLQELLGQQSKEQELVAQQQSQHQQLIVQINKSVKSEQDSIELLKDSEQQLKNLLDKTLKLQSTVTLTGLQKGKIVWPIKGVIRHHYNTTRQGQVRWKGVERKRK